jgi:DNA invertase Pin-like site-specific DNA recombinase
MRAALYVRVSTQEQAQHGVSMEEQERLLQAYAETQEWTAEAFVDAGLSGRKADNRPALQDFLSRLDEFDRLVVFKLDRLARGNVDLWGIVERLQRAQVELVSLSESFDTSSGTGRLLLGVLSSVAEMESSNTSERVKMAAKARARQGRRMGGPRPFGYAQKDGALTLLPHEAQVLRRSASEVLQGRSLRQIAEGLNLDGITTTTGVKWSQMRLSQLLKNRLYVGKVRYRDEEFQGVHAPVFMPEEWDELQAVMALRRSRSGKGRGRQPKEAVLARGMGKCGWCGANLFSKVTKNQQGRVYRRYRCAAQVSGASPDCEMPSVGQEVVDSALLDYFHHVGLDVDATRRRIAENAEQVIAETRASLAHAERQRAFAEDRLARVRRDYQDGKLDADDWSDHRHELSRERDAAAAEVDRLSARVDEVVGQAALLDSEQALLDQLADLRRAIARRVTGGTTVEALRAALLRLFDGFTLHPFNAPAEPPTLPEGWVRSSLYTHPDLMLSDKDMIVIEPHPRREMILDAEKEIAFPELRRVPLDARVRVSVSAP